MKKNMQIVIIGTGKRAQNLYIPIIIKMPYVSLRGICGKNYDKTLKIAKNLDVIGYKNIEDILKDKSVNAIIACVTWLENSKIYEILADSSKLLLLETPLGHNFKEIKKTFVKLKNRKVYTDIAEQYHLRPIEILKRNLISKGIFGDVFYAFNDGVGHEYHGISIIRSYLGFNKKLKKVYTIQKDIPYFKHIAHKNVFFEGERCQHSIMEFEKNKIAAFHWSWLNYESPIRSRRLSGFYGTKGSSWGEECVAFKDKSSLPVHIRFERRTKIVDGIEILSAIVVYFESKVICTWNNFFSDLIFNEEQIVASMFVKNMYDSFFSQNVNPLYSVKKAYGDYEIVEAMHKEQ